MKRAFEQDGSSKESEEGNHISLSWKLEPATYLRIEQETKLSPPYSMVQFADASLSLISTKTFPVSFRV